MCTGNVDVDAKFPSFESTLQESDFRTRAQTVPSSTNNLMAEHIVTSAKKDATGTVMLSDSDATDYQTQEPSKSVAKPLSDMKSEFHLTLVDLGVVTKTKVEPIVKNCLTKGPTLHSQESSGLPSLYSRMHYKRVISTHIIASTSCMFYVVEQALAEWSNILMHL